MPQKATCTSITSRVQRNHALEHATMNIFSKKGSRRMLAGYSDIWGFWILGGVDTIAMQEAVDEGLARLKKGERKLAISPNCGTNFVTSGLLAGAAAWLAMINTGAGVRRKLERLPVVVALVTLALVVSQPLGIKMQANLTTTADVGDLQVTEIMMYEIGRLTIHRVKTRY